MKQHLLKNTYAAIVALFIGMMVLPTTAQAQVFPGRDLLICSQFITAENYRDLSVLYGVSGKVSYDPDSKTLTLENAKLRSGPINEPILSRLDGLTIKLIGNNIMESERSGIVFRNSMKIIGEGSLKIKLNGPYGSAIKGELFSTANLTIEDCTIDAIGHSYGIEYLNNFVLKNATVTALGEYGSICGIGSMEFHDCVITSPLGAAYYDGAVSIGEESVKSKVIIEPGTNYDLWIGGIQVNSSNHSYLYLLRGVTGKVKYDPDSKTLTLNNAVISSSDKEGIKSKIDKLTIQVDGTNNVITQAFSAIKIQDGETTFSGDGKLKLSGKKFGLYAMRKASVTVDNCNIECDGSFGTDNYDAEVNIYNSTVTAKGKGYATMRGIKEFILDECVITQPMGAYYDSKRNGIVYKGNLTKEKVVIAPVTEYDLYIAGEMVHSANCNDLSYIKGVSGTVKYDPDNNILTLENATINAGGGFAILSESDDLTIKVIGTNNITSENYSAVNLYSSATITGGGTLRVDCTDETSIYAISTDRLLTIKDCTVNAKGRRNGIKGNNSPLVIKNATVTAEGREEGSICDFKEITLEGCAITQPAGAAFDESKHAVVLNGAIVTSEVKIEPVTKYDLEICGTWVTSGNCGDLSVISGVSGWVKYDPDNKILTLEDATLNAGENDVCIRSKIDGLTIKVSGTNELNAGDAAAVVYAPTTITGGDTLNAKSQESCAIYTKRTNLTIKNCIVNAKGKWGIAGDDGSKETLRISNATVTAEGREGSICDFKEITLEDCAITQPAGAAFDESKHAVVLNGAIVASEVKIVPTKYDLWIAGTQVTSGNCGDLSVIPGVRGTVKYDPNTKTLTLKDATIYTAEKRGIGNNVDGQTILLFGENTIASKKFDGVSNGNVTLTITGSGKLTVNGAMTGVGDGFCLAIDNSEDGTVIIDGCTLEASAGCYGFSEGCWKFINCTVRVKGGGSKHDEYAGSICNLLEEPTFIGCAVISPAKAYWGDRANISYDTRYDLYGEDKKVVTDWVIIADPTGINTPTIDIAAKQGIYTLSGVKLDGEVKDLPKGVYIVNGKKFVKK